MHELDGVIQKTTTLSGSTVQSQTLEARTLTGDTVQSQTVTKQTLKGIVDLED